MSDSTQQRNSSTANPTGAASRTPEPLPLFPDLTRGQVLYAGIIAFVAMTLAVYDLVTFGTLLPIIQADFHWSTATASYVATFISLGSLVFAILVGPLIDIIGRRRALFITTSGAALSSGLAALAIGPISLILLRSLSGFGMSEQSVNAAYLNEIFKAKSKGFMYSLVQSGWPIGVMLSALIAEIATPSIGWRGTFIVATFPLIVVLLFRKWLKESPYFQKIQYLRRLQAAGDLDNAAVAAKAWQLEMPSKKKNTYAQIFAPELRKRTIVIGGFFFLKLIGDSQMTILATTVLVHGKGIDISGALWTVFIANGVAVIGYLLFGFLGDRIGRRETVIGCEALAAVATVLLLLVANDFVSVVIFYSMVLFFAQGAAAPFFAYVGEAYPTRVRGTGAAFVGIAGPIGGVVGPLVYAALQSAGLSATTAALSGALAALLSAATLLGARRIRPGQELAHASH